MNPIGSFSPIKWKRAWDHKYAMPRHATCWSAGFDLMWVPPEDMQRPDVRICPGEVFLAKTGWCVQAPIGHVGLIRDLAGMAMRGISTRSGVIDNDFRGEIGVVLVNDSNETQIIRRGTKVAQILFTQYWQDDGVIVCEFSDAPGFGSYADEKR